MKTYIDVKISFEVNVEHYQYCDTKEVEKEIRECFEESRVLQRIYALESIKGVDEIEITIPSV